MEVFELSKNFDGTFGLFSEDFAERDEYIDYVINACEGDLKKVEVYGDDFHREPLSNIIVDFTK